MIKINYLIVSKVLTLCYNEQEKTTDFGAKVQKQSVFSYLSSELNRNKNGSFVFKIR